MHKQLRLLAVTLVFVLLMAVLTGCTTVTAPSAADGDTEPKEKKLAEDGWQTIVTAIENGSSFKRFGIEGKMATRERDNYHRAEIYGHVILPDTIRIAQFIDGQSYYMYQDKEQSYFREQGKWSETERVMVENPWQTMTTLINNPPEKVYQLKDASFVTTNDTAVYQFEADAIGLLGLTPEADTEIPSLYTIYIDKEGNYVRKIGIISTSAVDDIGTVVTDVSVRFFSIDKEVPLDMPDDLVKHLGS